jgi:hypothetical protein
MRALLLAVCLFGPACHRDPARPPTVGPSSRPTNEAECRACNGDWGVHGMRPEASCLCRTHDAGKVCKDGNDCEGECEAAEGQTEVVDKGPPPRGYFLGKCTGFDHVFGCRKLLADGAKARGPVRLDEPLTEMCID